MRAAPASRSPGRRLGALLLSLGLAGGPAAAEVSAQTHPQPTPTDDEKLPALMVGNAALGGAVAGLGALIRGEDPLRAALVGSTGGIVSFWGKHLAARYPEVGGLAGRQLAALGHGVALNASRGSDAFADVWLAFGPLRVRVRNEGGFPGPPVRVNLASLAAALGYGLRSGTSVSIRDSALTGALVFEVPDHLLPEMEEGHARGVARGATVALNRDRDFDRAATLGHELVHVIQADFVTRLVTAPLERGVRHRVGLDAPALDTFEVSSGLHLFNYDPFLGAIEEEAVLLER